MTLKPGDRVRRKGNTFFGTGTVKSTNGYLAVVIWDNYYQFYDYIAIDKLEKVEDETHD